MDSRPRAPSTGSMQRGRSTRGGLLTEWMWEIGIKVAMNIRTAKNATSAIAAEYRVMDVAR